MRSKIFLTIILLATFSFSQWHKQMVDNSGNAGKYTRILLDSSGNPHIFYVTNDQDIMHAAWRGTGWYIERLYNNNNGGEFGVALDRNGRWHLCWAESTGYPSQRLHYGYNLGNIWKDTILSQGYSYSRWFFYPTIAVDTLNRPHIIVWQSARRELQHWWYVTEYPARWESEIIESGNNIRRPSVFIDQQNKIYVAYYSDGDLKLAYHDGTQWSTHIVDLPNDVGDYCSLKIDQNGRVCISYYDATTGDLKYAVGTPSQKNLKEEK